MIRYFLDGGRQSDSSAFEDLIKPLSPEGFFNEVWDKDILLVEGDASPFGPPIDLDQFLVALFEVGVGCQNLIYLHPSEPSREQSLDSFFRNKMGWEEAPSAGQLAQETLGGTLVFSSLEMRIPGARAWCQKIFEATGCRTKINGYFSSGQGANAFGAHCDDTDVFVVQIAGEKDWLLWNRSSTPPTPEDPVDARGEPACDEKVRLVRGSMLYMPRNVWHWPKTAGEEYSFHLTVTVKPRLVQDILDWLEHGLLQEDFAKSILPMSRYQSDKASSHPDLDKALAMISAQVTDPDAKGRAVRHLAMQNLRTMHAKPKD
ncbi:MAG: cupin domain-containing protein [Pseudomonadota bacterium]